MLQRIWRYPCRPVDGRALPETPREEKDGTRRKCPKNIGSVVPRVRIRADKRVFRRRIHAARNPERARSRWCRMRPIKGRQVGNVGWRPPMSRVPRLAALTVAVVGLAYPAAPRA